MFTASGGWGLCPPTPATFEKMDETFTIPSPGVCPLNSAALPRRGKSRTRSRASRSLPPSKSRAQKKNPLSEVSILYHSGGGLSRKIAKPARIFPGRFPRFSKWRQLSRASTFLPLFFFFFSGLMFFPMSRRENLATFCRSAPSLGSMAA